MVDIAALGFEVRSTEVKRANDELNKMPAAAGKAERAAKGLDTAFRSAGVSAQSLVAVIGRIASIAAVIQTVRAATTAAYDLDKALGETSTLLNGTAVEMQALEGHARRFARTFGGNATQQVKAFYQAISAGAPGVEEAAKTLEIANKLAIGGVTGIETAVDGLTSVLNAYGSKVEGATAVSDAMFVAMKAGKTTIGELSASLGAVAPLAAQMGVSFDELMAATAALTKGGISTNVAITGLRAILAAVAKPSDEAMKAAKALGIEFNTAAIQAKGFQGFIEELRRKTGGSTDALAKLFGGVEALTPALALAGQAGTDFNNIMEEMGGKAGATDEAFGKVSETLSQRLDVAVANFRDRMYDIGQNALPFVVSAIEKVNSALSFMLGLFDQFGKEGQRGSFVLSKIDEEIASTKASLDTVQNWTPGGVKEWISSNFGESRQEQIATYLDKLKKLNEQRAQIVAGMGDIAESGPTGVFNVPPPANDNTGGGGGLNLGGSSTTKLNEYQKEIQAIREKTAALQFEASMIDTVAAADAEYRNFVELGLPTSWEATRAASQLAQEQELVNAALAAGKTITPELSASISQMAAEYAKAEVNLVSMQAEQERAAQQTQFARDVTGSFIQDLRSGLQSGEGFWKSFANAAISAIDKITDRILNQLLDALFQVNNAGGGNFLSTIMGSLFGGGAPTPIGAPTGSGFYASLYHDGGMIGANDNKPSKYISASAFKNAQRWHNGNLSADERPIIAQTGELMLSRRDVANARRAGMQGGGNTFAPNISIDARGSAPGVEKAIRREVDDALKAYNDQSYDRFLANHNAALKQDFNYRNG